MVTLVASAFGSSSHLINGPTNAISLVVLSALVGFDAGIRYVVLRLRRTRTPDVVAIEHLERFLRDAHGRGVTVLLAGVRPSLAEILHNVGFHEWLPADRIYLEKGEDYSATLNAVRHAYRLLNRENEAQGKEVVYYLV